MNCAEIVDLFYYKMCYFSSLKVSWEKAQVINECVAKEHHAKRRRKLRSNYKCYQKENLH